jgi:RimJ/RimL family protein N-acetyltransferase
MAAYILGTPRLRLREYRRADVDELADMFADEETMTYYPRPKTRDESLAWIEWNLELYEAYGFGLWVMEARETGEFLGDRGLTLQTVDGVTDIEVGWHTRKDHWGKGFATEAAISCRDLAFQEIGLRRLISIIHPDNLASIRVAEKLGMIPGKRTQGKDGPVVVYAIDPAE